MLGVLVPRPDGSSAPDHPARNDPADGGDLAARAVAPSWLRIGSPVELFPWAAAIDELVERQRLPALASWAWHSAFWEAFYDGDPRVAVQLVHRNGRVLAALPLRRRGRLLRTSAGLENEHFVYWAAAADTADPQLGSVLLDRVLEQTECFELRRLPLDGPLALALAGEARRRELPVVIHENADGEVSIPLRAPFAEFEKTISKNLRRDGRQLTKLEALGQVEFEVVESEPRLGVALGACFELEARGWKGASGSPVLADARTHRLYRTLAERAADRGRMRLFLLKLDGRIIAFEYDLCAGQRVDCLKIGYDESLARFSPGTVLRMMLLRRVIERGEATSYHLGRASAWKQRWVSQVDRIGTLQIYAGSPRGRLAHLGGPRLRSLAKKIPGARPLMNLVLREDPDDDEDDDNDARPDGGAAGAGDKRTAGGKAPPGGRP